MGLFCGFYLIRVKFFGSTDCFSATMNIRIPLLFFIFCASFALNSYNNFDIEQSKSDESVILGEILTNFFIKYISDEQIFIAIILEPLQKEQNFQQDLFVNLFDNAALTKFAFSISYALDEVIRGHRNAFNLILIENTKVLE